jgi:hypothetical protein
MHIYIDESGQFIPLNRTKSRAAAVVALVIPTANRVALVRRFKKARKRLRPGVTEIKGSSLSEDEAAEILAVLCEFDLLLEAVVLDVGLLDEPEVTRFKLAQADRLLHHITREHQLNLVQEVVELQQRLARLPNQLFIQAFCMIELVSRLLETATMYYSQRAPQELGAFHWRIDAKGQRLTPVEDLWTLLVQPIIYTQSLETPMGMMPGGDYTFFQRFDAPPDPDSPPEPGRHKTDLTLVFREDLRFVRSQDDIGLQIVDAVASVVTRALNGTLQQSGWQGLGKLLIRRKDHTIWLITLSPDDVPRGTIQKTSNARWSRVVRIWEAIARPMVTPEVWRDLEKGGA